MPLESQKIARWKIVLVNVVCLALVVPLAFAVALMGVFAGDSGPSALSLGIFYAGSVLIWLEFGAIVYSQIRRSRASVYLCFAIPLVPIAILLLLVLWSSIVLKMAT